MEVKLGKIEHDIKTLYKKNEETKETMNEKFADLKSSMENLTDIMKTVATQTLEMRYLREDINKNEKRLDCLREEIDKHVISSKDLELEKYRDISKQITTIIVKTVLGLAGAGGVTTIIYKALQEMGVL